jgi:hypothetical protein
MSPGVFPAQVTTVETFGFNAMAPKRKNDYGIVNVQLTDSSKNSLDLSALSAPLVVRPPNPGGDFAEPVPSEVYNLEGCATVHAP